MAYPAYGQLPAMTSAVGVPGGMPGAGPPQMKWWQRMFAPQATPGMDPALMQRLTQQSMLQAGLGMIGQGSRGRSFGEGAADAFGTALAGVNQAAQQSYQNNLLAAQFQQQQTLREADERRAEAEESRRQQQHDAEQLRQKMIDEATTQLSQAIQDEDPIAQRRALERIAIAAPDRVRDYATLATRYEQEEGPGGSLLQRNPLTNEVSTLVGRAPATAGVDAPSGYRLKSDGSGDLEPIPGGPADPTGPGARTKSMQLRKEFEDQPVVKEYRTVLPLYQRASTAPDTRAGDISVIYALGKMFDPTSVVREGELQLSMNAAPWLQKIAAEFNSQMTGQGRLTPEMRADIMAALNGQVEAMRAPYVQERGRYSQYAVDSGFGADSVVGPDPAEAFEQNDDPLGIR